ncbi:MAG: transcriptional repressor [Clostridia bacterium]|nr:transcriptional repressor [Clostridia bacterium]
MHKHSRQRDAVLTVLRNTKEHPTAEVIYEEVKKQVPNISLGTVYRNLRLLVDMGEILELITPSCSRFDGDISEHYHFTCRSCGRVYDLPSEAVTKPSAKMDGFRFEHCRMDFSGICPDC